MDLQCVCVTRSLAVSAARMDALIAEGKAYEFTKYVDVLSGTHTVVVVPNYDVRSGEFLNNYLFEKRVIQGRTYYALFTIDTATENPVCLRKIPSCRAGNKLGRVAEQRREARIAVYRQPARVLRWASARRLCF